MAVFTSFSSSGGGSAAGSPSSLRCSSRAQPWIRSPGPRRSCARPAAPVPASFHPPWIHADWEAAASLAPAPRGHRVETAHPGTVYAFILQPREPWATRVRARRRSGSPPGCVRRATARSRRARRLRLPALRRKARLRLRPRPNRTRTTVFRWSGSGLQRAAWRPSASSCATFPPTPAWPSSSSSICPPSTRASSPRSSPGKRRCRCRKRPRTCLSSPTTSMSFPPGRTW